MGFTVDTLSANQMWPNPVFDWPAVDSSEGLCNITKWPNADQYIGWLMLFWYCISVCGWNRSHSLFSKPGLLIHRNLSFSGHWVGSASWNCLTSVSDPESRVKKSCVAARAQTILPVFIRYWLTNTTKASSVRDLEESRRQSWFISTLFLEQHTLSELWGMTDAHTLLLFIF